MLDDRGGEMEAVLEVLFSGAKQLGFYSCGEILLYVSGQTCQLHNQTMAITSIAEMGSKCTIS